MKRNEEEIQARQAAHDIATLCRFYGWTYHYVIGLPLMVFNEMLEQVEQIRARENIDLLLIQHSKDPKWLYERWKALAEWGKCGAPITDEDAAAGWEKLKKEMTG